MRYLKYFESLSDLERVKADLKDISYLIEDESLTFSIEDSKNSIVDYYFYIIPVERRNYMLIPRKVEISKSGYFLEFIDRSEEIFNLYGFNLGKISFDQTDRISFEIISKKADTKPWQ